MTQTSEAIHQCQACDTLWTEEQITPLEEVKDLFLRIDPGEVVPSGECPDPDCGALTHLTGRDGQDREVGMMAQAEFDKRADQRRDAEDAEYEMTRTLHDEQMQKYGAAPAPERE